jgi:hypothetical protein
MFKKAYRDLFQHAGSGTCPDPASPTQALTVLELRRDFHVPLQQAVEKQHARAGGAGIRFLTRRSGVVD